jgi:hypothetical protein
VVIAGGREAPHWEAYPGHQFIHTVGVLRCCATGGCWKSHTKPLGDGKDAPGQLSVDVRGELPACMDLITRGRDPAHRTIPGWRERATAVRDGSRARRGSRGLVGQAAAPACAAHIRYEAECRAFLGDLAQRWDGRLAWLKETQSKIARAAVATGNGVLKPASLGAAGAAGSPYRQSVQLGLSGPGVGCARLRLPHPPD